MNEGLRFVGEMVYESHRLSKRAPDREGNDDRLIVFELRPLTAVVEKTEDSGTA